ncbi:MAG: nucleotide sugar dehydrogenase, partial [Planctomycetaceae bacterium]|nr:nucleotide sugar dehydrogenase [Planctomycetaceae bacterium]
MANQLEQAIKDKTATIGIIGLGYVGLPLIDAFVNSGFKTMGFDVDQFKVDQLQAGKSYIQHIPSKTVANWLEKKQFEATAEASRMKEADALLICVPTPLTTSRDPDLTYVEKTTEAIAASLRPGQLVVLESTTYPTTTRDVMLPILDATGLKVGEDYFLAYSPEREDPGNPDFSAAGIPKVVGGIDENSLRIAAALYEHAVVNVIQVSSVEIAEACKILENTYRAV